MAANFVSKSNRRRVAIDVTVCNNLGPHNLNQDKMLQQREQSKKTHYTELGQRESAVIVPAVVSTFGALGSDFITLINKTKGEALRRGKFVPGLDPDFVLYWTQNIVCTVAKRLAQAAQRAVTHQQEHHHALTAPCGHG